MSIDYLLLYDFNFLNNYKFDSEKKYYGTKL